MDSSDVYLDSPTNSVKVLGSAPAPAPALAPTTSLDPSSEKILPHQFLHFEYLKFLVRDMPSTSFPVALGDVPAEATVWPDVSDLSFDKIMEYCQLTLINWVESLFQNFSLHPKAGQVLLLPPVSPVNPLSTITDEKLEDLCSWFLLPPSPLLYCPHDYVLTTIHVLKFMCLYRVIF